MAVVSCYMSSADSYKMSSEAGDVTGEDMVAYSKSRSVRIMKIYGVSVVVSVSIVCSVSQAGLQMS